MEQVTVSLACPRCGNRDTDELVWSSGGGLVLCAGCGTVYDPNEPAAEYDRADWDADNDTGM